MAFQFTTKYPGHLRAAVITSPTLKEIHEEFDRMVKGANIYDGKIHTVLQYLKDFLQAFRRTGTRGDTRLTLEQVEEEFHYYIPKIIAELEKIDRGLLQEVKCGECGEKTLARGAVWCPQCGERLRG